MKFAIRDDDTAFYTSPDDLQKAYSFIERGCVSLSVVPMAVPRHKDAVFPYGCNFAYRESDIRDNSELIDYLAKGYSSGKYDILLHGYSHEYKKVGGVWKAEMLWKEKERLLVELEEGKRLLEEALGCDISVFVAPNNMIDQKGIAVIETLGLDFSGTLKFFDREMSPKYIKNFLKRWMYRITHSFPYGGPLVFEKHIEMHAFTLRDFDLMKQEFEECKRMDVPFVVYTHYWSLLADSNLKKTLSQVYEYALANGAELAPLSSCY